jgi:hypothetical protein
LVLQLDQGADCLILTGCFWREAVVRLKTIPGI